MNKIFTLAAMALLMASCGNGNKAEEIKPAPVDPKATAGMAYVDVDTLQARYQFYLDGKARLEQKMEEYQKGISQKENALANLQKSIQQRTNNGQINSQPQYEAELKKYQQQEQAYAQYRAKAEQEMVKPQGEFNQALQDSLDNFLAEYNKVKKFKVIFYKAAAVYADKSMDITAEVAEGLNKRYKK